jgi:Tfp pilus assembly protein PilX
MINARSGERGVALIVALIVMLVLCSLAAAILFVTETQTWTTHNYRMEAQARFLADAAAARAVNWFVNSYQTPGTISPAYTVATAGMLWNNAPVTLAAIDGQSSNFPSSADETSFYAAVHDVPISASGFQGEYSATATLVDWQAATIPFSNQASAIETWQITAQGEVKDPAGNAVVQETVTLTQQKTPLMAFATFATSTACGAVNLGGGAYTNSFDSSQGTYSQTESSANGNVGSQGNVTLGAGATVNGTASVPNPMTGACPAGVTLGSNASVTGQETGGSETPLNGLNDVPPMPQLATVTPGTGTLNVGQAMSLLPGAYGDITLASGGTLTFAPGSYYINSLSVSGTGTITISPAGQVILYVAGNGVSTPVSLTGNSLTNNTDVPADFQIVYGGTGTIEIAGGSAAYAVVYAPDATVEMTGGSDWYGSIISNTFNEMGNKTALHYDRNLVNQYLVPGPFQAVSVSRSKY